MGASRENKLPIRRLEKVGLAASFAAGAALTPGTISGDVRSLLITFLGLIAASILPTISLLVNSMTASGRSVKAINRLHVELEAAMDALFFLFGCVAVAVGALVTLAIPPPEVFAKIPYLSTDVLPRGGQAVVVCAVTMILIRAGQIPAILRGSLSVRHEIAVAEARRKLAENAPKPGAMKQAYANHPDFGKVVTLDEVQGRDPH